VRYEVRGPLRDVLICHCTDCRRWHGHLCAMTATHREALALEGEQHLRWFTTDSSDANARRGFCGRCGSSMFWDSPERETISISAGTLDAASGLRVSGHIYVAQAGDYYDPPDGGSE
jgi:hypothetical protein